MGVTTRKKTNPMTIGAIILPSNSPNLIQSLFKGDKSDEFNKPRIKNISEIINDQTLKSPPLNIGYSEIIKKTTKNTNPKLLFELIFISFI